MARYLGYSSHNGEYKVDSEDINKCWVECENETASFFLNSNKISKVVPNTNLDYEDYLIADPIVNKNGRLYSTIEGIKIGFNVTFDYDEQLNTINIYTLPYLLSTYETRLKQYGFSGQNESFKNQKAVLYNLFIVRKSNNLCGVINGSGEEIISSKYKNIEFNESGKEFYVRNNYNKVGILTNTGVTKINLIYDDISMIDKQIGLYIVKNGNKYGVLDNNGNIIIHLEYEKIGVDTSNFLRNNISNKFILYESVIPVYQNEKWGLFNTHGEIIVPVEFDKIGCVGGTSKNTNVNNVLIIPSYKAIILGKVTDDSNKTIKYAVYNNLGNELIKCALDTVYSITNGGIDKYYMEYKGNTLDVEEYIKRVHYPESSTDNT